MKMPGRLTAQERAAIVTLEIASQGKIKTRRACELTGLTQPSAYRLICAISRSALPLILDHEDDTWYIQSGELQK